MGVVRSLPDFAKGASQFLSRMAVARQAIQERVEDGAWSPANAEEQTLLSDGHIMLRHHDWSTTYEMAAAAATQITMYAE